jgi:thiamine biosynthesis lipoprotein
MKSFWLIPVLLLTACSPQPREFRHTILQFDTLINVSLYAVNESVAAQAFAELDREFAAYHSHWTPYAPSAMTSTNQLIASGHEFSVPPSVLALITESLPLAEKTGDLYNPAIGKLIKLWQFHRHDEPDIKPPEPQQITELVAANPRLGDLQIDGTRMRSHNLQVELNFGAFAKGYAVDRSIQHLHDMGIHNAILAAGGDIKAVGTHGDRAWRVAIKHPRQDGVIASLDLRSEESISTSGDYERFYFYQGQRYSHILDPRTGYPARGAQSVTVLHTSAGLADVAATALFIAGPEHWFELAKKLQLQLVLFIDAQGVAQVTPALQERLQFNPDIQTAIQTTSPL